MTLMQTIQSKRDEILRIAARHGAQRVRLFGSVARGDAGPQSDVDFLVQLESGRSLFDRAALWLELKQLLGCNVDVVTEKGLKPRLQQRILREAIPL